MHKKNDETDEIQDSSPRTKMLGRPVNRFQEAKVRLACYTAFEDNLVDVEHPYKKAGLSEVHNVDIKYRQLNLAL